MMRILYNVFNHNIIFPKFLPDFYLAYPTDFVPTSVLPMFRGDVVFHGSLVNLPEAMAFQKLIK